MVMLIAYVVALAEAGSSLAVLADHAADFDESMHYEHLLIDLDALHPIWPLLCPITGTKTDLLVRLERAVDEMLDLGEGDGRGLELLLRVALLCNGLT